MTDKATLYQKAAALYRQAVASGADETAARAKYDAAVARIAAMPEPAAGPVAQPDVGEPRTKWGFGRSVAQGATFGFGDEIEAGARGMLPGRTVAGELRDIRAGKAKYESEHPARALAGELVGGAATSLIPAVGAAKAVQTGSKLARVAAAMSAGAASGAVSGFGSAEGSFTERLPQAGMGAAGGAVLAPVVGAVVGKAASSRAGRALGSKAQSVAARLMGREPGAEAGAMLPKAEEKALAYAGQAFTRDKGDLGIALRERAPAGDLVFNRGGRSVATATRVAQAVPGEGTSQVPRAIYSQLEAEPERLVGALERTAGRPLGNAQVRLQELADIAAREAKPFYEKMEGQVFTGEDLDELLQRPGVAEALAEGRRNLRSMGRKAPSGRLPNEPALEVPSGGAPRVQDVAPKPPKAGQSERGLYLTAKTERGQLRKAETVETAGLLDDLLRRQDLDLFYHKSVRKYGPNSAVTRRNQEAIVKIQEILEKRDGIAFEQLDDVLRTRRATLAESMGQDQVSTRDLERMVHAAPGSSIAPKPSAAPVVQDAVAVPADVAKDPAKRAAYVFEELDNAKKVLDARIGDLEDKVEQGIDKSRNELRLLALRAERSAVVDYLDRETAGQYAEARGVAERFIGPRESFRAGTKYGAATSRDQLALDQAARTAEERGTFLEGVAHRVRDDVERAGDRRDVARRFFGSSYERDKLAAATGNAPEIADAFTGAMRRQEQARAALVPGQSMTAPMGEALADFRGGDLLHLVMQAKSLPRQVALAVAKRVAQLRGVDEEAAGLLGRLMTAEPGSPAALQLADRFQRLYAQRQSAQRMGERVGQVLAGQRAGRP